MAITEYYNNLRQLIHLNLQVPVYSESTFENQNVSLPCIVFSRDGTLGSQTMSGPSVMTETVTFSAKAKTIEKAEEMRDFIISILNGYDNEIQMVLNSETDDFDIDTGIYTRGISFDVVYGADIPYRNVVIGEGSAGQIAIWQDRYILTGSNVMTITGSTVTFTGSVVVNGSLTVAGGFVAQNAVSASYALTSSFAASALTASYALNSIAGSSGTSGTSGANGSSGTSGTNGTNGSSGTSGTNGTNGSSGTSGLGGSSGTSGQSGSSGTSGANGSSGTSGLNGSSGTSGLNGSSGTSGNSGSSGTSGVTGSSGTSGQTGSSGTSGQNGSSGTSGLDGSSGTSGLNGSSGTSGLNGSSGTSGNSGSSGTSGLTGSSGTSGVGGSSGTSGIDGSSGTSGQNGSSGTSGQNGSSGTSGANGIDGSSGTSGQSGSSGTSGTNGTDGSSGTSGESGSSGTSGTSGENGSSGTSGLTQDLSGYVVTASGALNNLTASYALTSSYLDTTSLVLNNLTVNNSISASKIESSTGFDLELIAAHTSQVVIKFTDSSSIWFNDLDGNPEIWMTDANNNETAYIRNTGSYLEISPNNINAVKIGQTDVIFNVPITGSLEGTASYATLALSASYAPGSPSVSASYAETASYSETASYAMNAGGGSATASYLLGNASSSLIQFAETENATDAVAQLAWNSDLGTLKVGLRGGNLNIPLGMEEVAYVYNAEATTLNKGEVVYASGSVTDRIAVKRANASADATSARTLGIVSETIASAGSGYITTRGLILNVNTNAYNAGDILYVSTSSGQLTNVKQYAPNHLVYAGIVTRVGVANGSIFTLVQNGYELDELHDVRARTPNAGDLLVYSSSGLWENTTTLPGRYRFTDIVTASAAMNIQGITVGTGSGNGFASIVFGNSALGKNTTGNTNIAIGNDALYFNTIGLNNLALGSSALYSNISGRNNTAIGHSALINNISGSFNTALGYTSLQNLTTGSNNIAIGYDSAATITTGSNNVIIGTNITGLGSTLDNNIILADGSGNIRLRVSASGHTTFDQPVTASLHGTSSYSTNLLYFNQVIPSSSIYIGAAVLPSTNVFSTNNVALGISASNAVTTADSLVTIGFRAGSRITTGRTNTLIGANSGLLINTSSGSVAIGGAALSNTSGSGNDGNVAVGFGAMRNVSGGNNNVAVGANTCFVPLAVSRSIYIGDRIQQNGNNEIVIGSRITGLGSNTTIIGTSESKIAYIYGSLSSSLDANINGITVGTGSGNSPLNTAVGKDALLSNTSGYSNTAFGCEALSANTSGTSNTAIGRLALNDNTIGTGNVAIGANALPVNTSGYSNTAIGTDALLNITTGVGNVGLGGSSLPYNSEGFFNFALGTNALGNNKTGSYNIAIGPSSLNSHESGSNNIGIGYQSLLGLLTGSNNLLIGSNIPSASIGSSLNNNIIIADGSGNIRLRVSSSGHTTFDLPVTASVFGTASYANNALTASYALSSAGGGGGGGTISSSFQLTNNQGFAFNTASFVTFGQVTSSNANITTFTASYMYAAGDNVFGDNASDLHRFIGNVHVTGSANITTVTASAILVDGYNQFGTSSGDLHTFIGTVHVTGSLRVTGSFMLPSGSHPTSVSSSGTLGEVRFTTASLYICVQTNTWRKVDLSTF